MTVPCSMGGCWALSRLWPYAIYWGCSHISGLFLFAYLLLSGLVRHTSTRLLVILTGLKVVCSYSLAHFPTEMSVFLLSVSKAFTTLNITTFFYYLHYKYLFPNLLFVNCLKYVFPCTNFKYLCSKYIYILFHSF